MTVLPRVFLSHNSLDKEYVRPLAAALQVTGAQVWFDEWKIRPGDSIPAAISSGIATFDIFALVWSANAADSKWVATEMESALTKWMRDESCRLIPIRLDRTPLPLLVSHLLYIDASRHEHRAVAAKLLGINSEREYREAIQQFLNEADLNFREFWGVGVMVACPGCGASVDKLHEWETVDYKRDDVYRGAKCTECGWDDGSEV